MYQSSTVGLLLLVTLVVVSVSLGCRFVAACLYTGGCLSGQGFIVAGVPNLWANYTFRLGSAPISLQQHADLTSILLSGGQLLH